MKNEKAKSALICGISGQDGAYLAKLLLDKGYTVYGTSRDAQISSFNNLVKLGIKDKVELFSMSLIDFRSVLQTVSRTEPGEIYNLAGQSSVGLSFELPVETLESITTGTINLLEVIRFTGKSIKFYNAGSSECFGNITEKADENTPFHPRSPYAASKAAAFWIVANYREAYNIFACSGILFNHESPLRHERFVTKKIINTVKRIAGGSKEKLVLGNIGVSRDWGWAPEYVNAMYLMLQSSQPDDFIISTGESHSLREFINEAFAYYNINAEENIIIDPDLFRPTDLNYGCGNAAKAKRILNWQAESKMKDVVRMMIEEKLF